jgi:hypothetical protein
VKEREWEEWEGEDSNDTIINKNYFLSSLNNFL